MAKWSRSSSPSILPRRLRGPDEAEIEAAYAANELVLGHFGNWRQGQRAIYLGAPRDTMKHGSYWEWVALLAGPGPDLDGEVPVPISPDGPTTPYTARREPDADAGDDRALNSQKL